MGVEDLRRAARIDETQTAIVTALRQCGATVWHIGLPVDLLVGFRGRTLIFECKRLVGKKAPKPAGYTDLQTAFIAEWKGSPVVTVTDVEGALAALKT